MNTTTKSRNVVPHSRYEGTQLYLAIEKAIAELVANNDLHIMTPHEKVIAHLCDRIDVSVPRFHHPRVM